VELNSYTIFDVLKFKNMYTEFIKDKTTAILEAQKMSKRNDAGYAALVWNEKEQSYYVMEAGDKIFHIGETIIGSYKDGKFVK